MKTKDFIETVTSELLRETPDLANLRLAVIDYQSAEDRRQERLYRLDSLTVDDIMALGPCWPRQRVERLFGENKAMELTDILGDDYAGPNPIEAHWLVGELLDDRKCEWEWTPSNRDQLYHAIDYICGEELKDLLESKWSEENHDSIWDEGYEEGKEDAESRVYDELEDVRNEAYKEGYDDGQQDMREQDEDKSIPVRVREFVLALSPHGPSEKTRLVDTLRWELDNC